jgi:hypothetical protein
MPAYVGAVLAEQQAVISLLMRRLRAAEYESVADAETLVRALFGHLKVAEHLLLPAFATSRHFASAKARSAWLWPIWPPPWPSSSARVH